MEIGKILIVADDSPPSVNAIEYGFNLARDLGAKVTLLSVVDPINAIGNPDAGVFPDDALMALKAKTEDFLNKMKSAFGAGVETELFAPVGDLQITIVNVTTSCEASLIVAGTHGRTGLSNLFKGSVAESIIHHASVPVCVVPIRK